MKQTRMFCARQYSGLLSSHVKAIMTTCCMILLSFMWVSIAHAQTMNDLGEVRSNGIYEALNAEANALDLEYKYAPNNPDNQLNAAVVAYYKQVQDAFVHGADIKAQLKNTSYYSNKVRTSFTMAAGVSKPARGSTAEVLDAGDISTLNIIVDALDFKTTSNMTDALQPVFNFWRTLKTK